MNAALCALEQGVTVVTATRRLARQLALVYNRRQLAAGRQAWRTPAVMTWDAWIAQLADASTAAGGALTRRAVLTDRQARQVWSAIVATSDAAILPGAAPPLAQLAMRSWRLCQAWQIAPDTLLAAADSADTLAFACWAKSFHVRCEHEGWIESAMLPAALAGDLQRTLISAPPRLHFVGFREWTPQQRDFLKLLTALGCEEHEEAAPRVMGARTLVVQCGDVGDELDRAARWARLHRERDPDASIAVVVPDLAARAPEVRRAFLDIMAPDWRLSPGQALPVNFSLGEPLAATGIVHIALLVLATLNGRQPLQETGQLLRTAYLAGGQSEVVARAQIDLACRRRQGRLIAASELAALASRHGAPVLAHGLAALCAIIDALPARQSPRRWADTFSAALRAAGWPGDRELGTDEYLAALALRARLDELGASSLIHGEMTLAEALGLLRSTAAEEVFQPAGDDAAIQVLGALEAVGQQFDALWVCGMTSEGWPPATRPDPLLPLDLQRQLRMPASSPPAVRERAESLLRWLEGSAAEVVLSWPAHEREEPLTPSPLIAHLPAGEAAGWQGTTRRQQLLRARTGSTLTDDPPPAVSMPCPSFRGGAGLLTAQARCPARAFLQFRLGAQELREPGPGLDAATRGQIIHAVLQALFSRIIDQRQLLELDETGQSILLEQLIDEATRRFVASEPTLQAILCEERARVAGRVAELLRAERTREPFRVAGTEVALDLAHTPRSVQSLQLALRADRIDERDDGLRLVIDYKTGRTPPAPGDLHGFPLRAPQLPLYALAGDADAVAFVQISSSGSRWTGVGRGQWLDKGLRTPEKLTGTPGQSWEALRNAWSEAVDRLARGFLDGDFSVDRWRLEEAQGQWAMATRVHELPEAGSEQE